MEFLIPKFRRDGNAMVRSAYMGVTSGHRTVTSITRVDKNADRLATTREFGTGIPRGQGGKIATLVLGGMETTLDEIEYILEGIRGKKFTPQHRPAEISLMCQAIAEQRNARIKHWRKNPSEAPKPRRRGLYLPTGYRLVSTPEPGLRITVKG